MNPDQILKALLMLRGRSKSFVRNFGEGPHAIRGPHSRSLGTGIMAGQGYGGDSYPIHPNPPANPPLLSGHGPGGGPGFLGPPVGGGYPGPGSGGGPGFLGPPVGGGGPGFLGPPVGGGGPGFLGPPVGGPVPGLHGGQNFLPPPVRRPNMYGKRLLSSLM